MAMMARRSILLSAAATLLCTPAVARMADRLRLEHAHTRDKVDLPAVGGEWSDDALVDARHFFRDWRAGVEHDISPRLLSALSDFQKAAGGQRLVLVSGFRTPETNARLPGTVRHSAHTLGAAADVTLPGVCIDDLARWGAAVARRWAGGIGEYPAEHFVHLDVVRPRHWGGGRNFAA